MWQSICIELGPGRRQYEIREGVRPLASGEVIELWANDPRFREFFNGLLSDSEFDAFRWETPPLTTATLDSPFEFVLLDCPALDRGPDQNAFAEHFQDDTQAVAFTNLRGDSVLVAPVPLDHVDKKSYAHLAAFCRGTSADQIDGTWTVVARTIKRRLSHSPFWLSTAGLGVAWLHFRLDDRPKYYGFAPYRTPPKT